MEKGNVLILDCNSNRLIRLRQELIEKGHRVYKLFKPNIKNLNQFINSIIEKKKKIDFIIINLPENNKRQKMIKILKYNFFESKTEYIINNE